MVYRRNDREAESLDPEEPIGKALIIVDDIEGRPVRSKVIKNAKAECEGFREPSGGDTEPLQGVDG